MMEAFYHSEAVEKPIPRSYMEHTFDTAASGSPFIRLYLMEEDGGIVGYSLVGFTYSNEAGGQVLWIQELYLEEGYRGKGIGGSFLDRMAELFQEQVVQLRLEPVSYTHLDVYKRQLPYIAGADFPWDRRTSQKDEISE